MSPSSVGLGAILADCADGGCRVGQPQLSDTRNTGRGKIPYEPDGFWYARRCGSQELICILPTEAECREYAAAKACLEPVVGPVLRMLVFT